MKFPLTSMKKWNPVWVGIVMGLGFGTWSGFHGINSNAQPFYVLPYIWLMQALTPLVKPPGQPPAHFYIFLLPCP